MSTVAKSGSLIVQVAELNDAEKKARDNCAATYKALQESAPYKANKAAVEALSAIMSKGFGAEVTARPGFGGTVIVKPAKASKAKAETVDRSQWAASKLIPKAA